MLVGQARLKDASRAGSAAPPEIGFSGRTHGCVPMIQNKCVKPSRKSVCRIMKKTSIFQYQREGESYYVSHHLSRGREILDCGASARSGAKKDPLPIFGKQLRDYSLLQKSKCSGTAG